MKGKLVAAREVRHILSSGGSWSMCSRSWIRTHVRGHTIGSTVYCDAGVARTCDARCVRCMCACGPHRAQEPDCKPTKSHSWVGAYGHYCLKSFHGGPGNTSRCEYGLTNGTAAECLRRPGRREHLVCTHQWHRRRMPEVMA